MWNFLDAYINLISYVMYAHILEAPLFFREVRILAGSPWRPFRFANLFKAITYVSGNGLPSRQVAFSFSQ